MIDSTVLKGVIFQCFEGFLELPGSFKLAGSLRVRDSCLWFTCPEMS